jgi:hypothetical protein
MISVLNKSLGFEIVHDNSFGTTIKMNARQAFQYALVTGASYLLSEYGIVLTNRLTVFYHRNYSFTPGLFNRNHGTGGVRSGDSPLELRTTYPHLFKGDKYILFVDVQRTSNIEPQIYKQLEDAGKNPDEYLLTKVMPTGAGGEHFCEYVACMLFNRDYYLTESQPPWSYYGNPDFAAYKLPEISELWERGFLTKGAILQELATLTIFGKLGERIIPELVDEYAFAVGEAKTAASNCVEQLNRYLEAGLCTAAYEIIPGKRFPEKRFGLISFNNDGSVNFYKCDFRPKMDVIVREKDKEWLLNYIKMYLVANMPILKLKSLVQSKTGSEKFTPMSLIKCIRKLPLGFVLDMIEEYV